VGSVQEHLLIITGSDGRSQSDALESGSRLTACKNFVFNVTVVAIRNGVTGLYRQRGGSEIELAAETVNVGHRQLVTNWKIRNHRATHKIVFLSHSLSLRNSSNS